MRVAFKLVALSAIMFLLTGSGVLLPDLDSEDTLAPRAEYVEQLLAEQEAELEQYRAELQQAGDELFTQKLGNLRREQAQRFQNEINALQAKMQDAAQAVQDEVSSEMLSLQLQLMLVSLSPEEQQEKLEQFTKLQDGLSSRLATIEEEYQDQLQKLEVQHEEQGRQEVLALQSELERAMDDELAHYQLTLLATLEEELEKLRFELGSAQSNRSY